ncbi:XRE family transcriptional regulator [Hungatella hathewayi]|uniref:XRE family transcriptional regulator n=1 Tax=Hungatella hathewayi TaxID=154046 RepID=A0A3E2WCF7_9FIRM|nr:XRE family transcriptional regulator [Hungatella hathewayi]
MLFHEKLRELRVAKGFSQHFVAQQLRINDRSYQNYEYGKREPNIDTLILLSAIFKVSLDELLCRDDFLKSHEVCVDEH